LLQRDQIRKNHDKDWFVLSHLNGNNSNHCWANSYRIWGQECSKLARCF